MNVVRRTFVLACIALLQSCGGGLDVVINNGGGVGTGGTGIVAGTITGLGSVIVDGVRYEESQAVLERRPDLLHSEALTLADLQLGQYVVLELDDAGNPTRVRVEPQLVGPAADVNSATGQFTVWGQAVAVNTDPGRGPTTVLSGVASLADLRASDPVQVYGVLQASDSGSDVIRATRIERLASADALPARITGTLQAGVGGRLLLAQRPLDVSAATTAPALAAGDAVTAVIPPGANLPGAWQASSVAQLAPTIAASMRVSGSAHVLAGGHVMVQGVEVDLSALPAAVRQAVREGSYLTIAGSASSQNGRQVVASTVEALPQSGRPAQLRGSITSVTSPTSFVVRGQAIDAAAAQISGGLASDLVVGAYVEVQGRQTPTGVVASTIAVSAVPPDTAVLDLTGIVQSVDMMNRVVRVQMRGGRTVVMKLGPNQSLPAAGQTIHAAGYWSGGTLQVRDFGR
jgi:hypothetical protein